MLLLSTWNKQVMQKGRLFAESLTGEFLLFSASTLTYQLSRLVVSLVVARWVGPDEFGVWNALNLILLYGIWVSLGISNGMNRNVPFLMGQDNKLKAEQIAALSFWFVFFSSLVAGILVFLASFSPQVPLQYRQSLAGMGVLFVFWQLYQYFQMRLKSYMRFNLMSLQQLTFAILLPVVVLPLAYTWRVPGFIAGQAILAVVLSAFIARISPGKLNLVWDRNEFVALVKIGFPIMLAGLTYSLFTSIDRWVVFSFLGIEALGHYTLPILCVSILNLLPAVISQQMYPRMAFHYGLTKSITSLKPFIIRQSLMATAVTVPILLLIYLILPHGVSHFLPSYRAGVAPAQILLIGLSFIPLAGGVANFLNTVDKQVYYLTVQVVAVIINFTLAIALVQMGMGLYGVALGATISYAVYAFTLILVGMYVIRTVRDG
jgi:O-antigen/teichoic acid export membrane protein